MKGYKLALLTLASVGSAAAFAPIIFGTRVATAVAGATTGPMVPNQDKDDILLAYQEWCMYYYKLYDKNNANARNEKSFQVFAQHYREIQNAFPGQKIDPIKLNKYADLTPEEFHAAKELEAAMYVRPGPENPLKYAELSTHVSMRSGYQEFCYYYAHNYDHNKAGDQNQFPFFARSYMEAVKASGNPQGTIRATTLDETADLPRPEDGMPPPGPGSPFLLNAAQGAPVPRMAKSAPRAASSAMGSYLDSLNA